MKSRFVMCLWAVALFSILNSCKKEKDPDYIPVYPYSNGAFISNEGTFGLSNASVSFYSFTADSVVNSVYMTVNNRPLGQVLQSMHCSGGKAYMVLNLSDTVVVAGANDFKQTGYITGLSSPRYMASHNGKGYITQWGGGGAVKVVDLKTNVVAGTISVGMGPEQVIVANGSILVCNGGAYAVDSTVSVIDPLTNLVVQTIEVGHNPKEMVVDRNNAVWVVCYGYIKYDGSFNIILETPSKLVKLSGQPLQKTAEYIISPTRHPQHIDVSIDGSTIYYGGGFGFNGIYAMDINAVAPPANPLVDGSLNFYGFNVNPANGDIFALDATDYTSPGILRRYSAQGALIGQYAVGVAPNGAVFK